MVEMYDYAVEKKKGGGMNNPESWIRILRYIETVFEAKRQYNWKLPQFINVSQTYFDIIHVRVQVSYSTSSSGNLLGW
jgi:hypothetical protein